MWAARTLFRADVGSAHIISREGRVRVGFYARNYMCGNAQRGAIFRAVHQCGKDNVRTRKCALQQCGVGHADSAVNHIFSASGDTESVFRRMEQNSWPSDVVVSGVPGKSKRMITCLSRWTLGIETIGLSHRHAALP